MEQNVSNFEEVIEEAKKAGLFRKETKTIFDVLEKKHLERALADVLAFFCNPKENECHQFGDRILRALLECVPGMGEIVEREQITLQNLIPEESTENKKRVDLVFEGDDWVLGVETKINAGMYNDFQQYRAHISSYNKAPFTIIFAPNADSAKIENWQVVQFGEFSRRVADKIKCTLTNNEDPSNRKWIEFLNDFLLNLTNLEGRIKMEKTQADFVISHYSDIVKIAKLKNDFEEKSVLSQY